LVNNLLNELRAKKKILIFCDRKW